MHIIFDLDGTISDSSHGVIHTLRKLFSRYNLPCLSDDEMKKYIGPPIEQTLGRYLSQDDIPEAVELYRKLYKEEGGIYENSMYEGIDNLLEHLKQEKHNIYLATTKEVNLAREILQIFRIDNFFSGIYGADPSKRIYTKTDVLNELFSCHEIDKNTCLLVGDTLYDVKGAQETGIKVGVVLYGYGKEQDFEGESVEFFVKSIKELYTKIEKWQNK